jgi:hypothetical protein
MRRRNGIRTGFAGYGVGKAKTRRQKGKLHPRGVLPRIIAQIAPKGNAPRAELHPDLMAAAGIKAYAHPGKGPVRRSRIRKRAIAETRKRPGEARLPGARSPGRHST